MRRGPLAAVLFLALPALAQAPPFDDSHIRVYYQPHNLWRSEQGHFVGRREGRNVVLVYDFFDEGERYSSCPSNRGTSEGGPDCGEFREAVGRALELWGEASGRLVLRRRESSSEPVNIWIAWAPPEAFGGRPPVARSVDNSRDASAPEKTGAVEDFQGFAKVAYPGAKKWSGALFFNDRYCWHVGERDACPKPRALPNGKVPEYKHDVRTVALHESGHVMGFGHFGNSSIMGVSGGSERYELTAYDREAVRRMYERVDASVPFQ